MNISIRIATPDDAFFIQKVYAYYVENTTVTFSETLYNVDYYRNLISTLLENYPYLIAMDEQNNPVGFACAEPVRTASGYRFSVEVTIYLANDTPKRKGIATLLYSNLLNILSEQGYCIAYSVIDSNNIPSIHLHERFEFKKLACFEKSGYKHNRWLNALWMQKQLNPHDNPPREPIPFAVYRKNVVIN